MDSREEEEEEEIEIVGCFDLEGEEIEIVWGVMIWVCFGWLV